MLLSSHVFAQQPDSTTFYKQGKESLRNNDFNKAVDSFRAAEQNGLQTSALYYNLGVALYKSGQYEDAKQSFLTALNEAEDPGLIYYNLGLTSIRLQQEAEAKTWFEKTATISQDEQLTTLANTMIARISGEISNTQETTNKPWEIEADLRLVHDDNITLENTELAQSSNLSDIYYDFYGSVKYQINGDSKNGYWVRADISSTSYQDYSQYDYDQYDLNLFLDKRYQDVAIRAGVKYSRSQLDKVDYMEIYRGRIQGKLYHSDDQTLRLRYELNRYHELTPSYAYLAGTRNKLKLDNTWKRDKRRYRLGIELEYNDRNDYRLGNNFTSYSATREKIYASFSHRFGSHWKIRTNVDYRFSKYNDASIINGVTDATREDDRFQWKLGGDYEINHVITTIEYKFSDNDSNIASKGYERNLITLGINGYF